MATHVSPRSDADRTYENQQHRASGLNLSILPPLAKNGQSNVTIRGKLTAQPRRDCMILRCDGMMRKYDLLAPNGNGEVVGAAS
jgi:hypothetical protein